MLLLGRDLRHAVRLFWMSPGVTLVSLLALAVGMGAATAIFSVADAVLLKPLGFREPDRLLVMWETNPAQNMSKIPNRAAVPTSRLREWPGARPASVRRSAPGRARYGRHPERSACLEWAR